MEFKDYYATLGVSKTASAKEIKQAFRRLARRYHPDVNPGDKAAEASFKDVNEANEVLGDPESRRKYDELGANWRMYDQAQRGAGPAPFSGRPPGEPGGYRTMTAEEAAELFGDAAPFSDFFTTFFGGEGTSSQRRGREGRRRPRQGGDIEHPIDLTLEEAHAGVTRRFSLSHGGRARSVDVRIPAGVGDGSRVRVAGEGVPGAGGGAAGDLFLRIRLAPHPVFERQDRDLYVGVPIPITTAVLGGEADVQTLSGKTARLRIPPLTQNAQVFRLKGYGMPVVGKPDDTGDLYARAEIQLPTELSREERAHFEALARLSGSGTPPGRHTRGGSSV